MDLTVTIERGRVTDIDFEGLTLAETFSALELDDEARAAERLPGMPAESASVALRDLLARVLGTDPD